MSRGTVREQGVRALEIGGAIVLALIALVVLKVLGILVKFALIAALVVFVIAFFVLRLFRAATQ
jgi:hypothetical protein